MFRDIFSFLITLGISVGLGVFLNFFLFFPKLLMVMDIKEEGFQKLKKKLFLILLLSFLLVLTGLILLRDPFTYPLILVSLCFVLFFIRLQQFKRKKSIVTKLFDLLFSILFFLTEAFRLRGLESFPSHFFFPFLGLFCLEIIAGSYLIFLFVLIPFIEEQHYGRKLLCFSLAYLGKLLDLPMGLFFLSLGWFSFEVSLYSTSFFSSFPWFLLLSGLLLFFRLYHQFFAEPSSTGILMRSLGPDHFCSFPINAVRFNKMSSFSLPSYVLECWIACILLFLIAFKGTSLFSFSSTLLPFHEQITGKTNIVSFSFNPFSSLPFKLQFPDAKINSPHLAQSVVVILKDRTSPYHVVAPAMRKEKETTYSFSATNFSHPGNWEIKVMTKTKEKSPFHQELFFTLNIPSGWKSYSYNWTFLSSLLFILSFSLAIIFLFFYLYRFSALFVQATQIWKSYDHEAKIMINYLGPNFRSRCTTFCSALFILGMAFLF
ncbi:hypothetical protein IT6_10145 [Methylacidiphilum caldifontis]|uniref:hypothetical protein n=1 Tax=Methylacidiphilum caldifontis TaxID=2795386 RepID=UPI001A8E550F|nr:hypothetical protein [Methylacidiphilum caldifontis]QSR88697.1 hypothetical protein IT6_10145 [Methylacidiphilum caldifontis]